MLPPLSNQADDEVSRLLRRLERERRTRLEAEAIAEKGLRDLYEKQQQLQLLEAIATTSNESTSVSDALQFAVIEICRYTGWPVGHVLLSDNGKPPQLTSGSIWHAAPSRTLLDFRLATEDILFSEGDGLPGRVLTTRQPEWVSDIITDENFPRALIARRAGLHTAFAFPVLIGTEVAAVLEFFSDRARERDEGMLRLMAQVGTQLGRVVERKRAEDRLVHNALHDPLTGLPNRTLFSERLRQAVARARRRGTDMLAVLHIDLDHFKVVNDSLGHGAGDRLLIAAAERLRGALAGVVEVPDGLSRLGGDEFAVMLDGRMALDQPMRLADRLHEALQGAFALNGRDVHLAASIGIAVSGPGMATAEEMLRDAELAMYRAKSQGRSRSESFDHTLHAMAVRRLHIETDLRRALERDEFRMHYQPIVALESGAVTGFEALLRWQRPGDEPVLPADFIQVAEDTGLILPVGRWALETACRQLRAWQAALPAGRPLSISVNLSARQFSDPNLVSQMREILATTGAAPAALHLEITESVAMEDGARTASVLGELRALGLQLSLDDFGTGYSSLAYLQRFPLDILKIDRSFVAELGRGSRGQMARAILSLARTLGLQVVAEGVETAEQYAELRALGCEHAQGFLLSAALPAEEAIGFLQRSLRTAKT